jgi:hypothetical protein
VPLVTVEKARDILARQDAGLEARLGDIGVRVLVVDGPCGDDEDVDREASAKCGDQPEKQRTKPESFGHHFYRVRDVRQARTVPAVLSR